MIGFFLILLFIGFLPFLVLAVAIYYAAWVIAYIAMFVLIIYGTIYKNRTGKDALVRVYGGSGDRKNDLLRWMERKGMIRLV